MPFTGKPVTQIQQCGIKINDNEVDRNEFRPWIIVFLSAEQNSLFVASHCLPR